MEWPITHGYPQPSMEHTHLDSFAIDPAFLPQLPPASGAQLMPAIPANTPNWPSSSSHEFAHSSNPHGWMSGLDSDCDLSPPPGSVALPSRVQSAYEHPVEAPAVSYMSRGQPRQSRMNDSAIMTSRLAPSNRGASRDQHNAVNTAQTPSPSSPPLLECKWEGCQSPTRFSREGDLVRHVKTIHISPGAYSCHYCGKSFGRKDHLREHQKRRHRVYQ